MLSLVPRTLQESVTYEELNHSLLVDTEGLKVDAMPPINVDVTLMDGRLVHMKKDANPATSLHPALNLLTRDILEFDGNTIDVLFYLEYMGPQVDAWIAESTDVVLAVGTVKKSIEASWEA